MPIRHRLTIGGDWRWPVAIRLKYSNTWYGLPNDRYSEYSNLYIDHPNRLLVLKGAIPEYRRGGTSSVSGSAPTPDFVVPLDNLASHTLLICGVEFKPVIRRR